MIQLVSNTKNFYVAALIPLFPFFGLISYYIIGSQRGVGDLKSTIIFGALSLISYFVFLMTLYFAVGKYNLINSLLIASASWFIVAIIITIFWNMLKVS